MGGWPVPGRTGRPVDPCGPDTRSAIRDLGDREPGERCSDKERRNRKDAPTVRRDVTLGAVCVAQRLVRRGELGIAAVAMVVTGVGGRGDGHRRRAWKIQAIAMTCQRELGPEQRRRREEDSALEPVPMPTADHDSSLTFTRFDATDPDQSPPACHRPGRRVA